tara:strand:+ start:617 stop:868 length:252 start_codon:yes stop_codon:yes gene_type:complete
MRYKKTNTITDKNNIMYYETVTPVYAEKTNDDIYVITEYGDRLDLLADQYYGDPMLWHKIADANNLNLINVKAGVRLRIPPKD